MQAQREYNKLINWYASNQTQPLNSTFGHIADHKCHFETNEGLLAGFQTVAAGQLLTCQKAKQ